MPIMRTLKLHGCLTIYKYIRWDINLNPGLRPILVLVGSMCTQMLNVK